MVSQSEKEVWKQFKRLNVDEIIQRLPKKGKWSGEWYNTTCPNPHHDDKTASFGIRDTSDGPHANCFVCEQIEVAKSILNLMPNSIRTDFAPRPKPAKKTQKTEEEKRRLAILNAKSIIQRSTPVTTEHPYIKRKGVEIRGELYHCPLTKAQMKKTLGYVPAFKGVELETPYLAAPVTNGGELAGLQLIGACGSKVFISGTNASGSYWDTETIPEAPQKPIAIGEGIATVLSGTQATGHYGEAGFNFDGVLKLLAHRRAEHPDATIYLLAELCKKTRKVFNAEKLYAAAKRYNAKVIIPTTTGTDFNDQHLEHGLDSVVHSINAQLIDIRKYKNKAVWKALKETKRFAPKVEEALKSENQASWVFYLCWQFLYRNSYTLPRPTEFIHQFPSLSDEEKAELSTYFEWRLLFRTHRALNPYRLNRTDLHLKRDENDQVPYDLAIQESSKAKCVALGIDHGSGKTSSCIKSMIAGKRTRVIVHRQSLAKQIADVLEIDYREDTVWPTESVATCYHSLLHPRFNQAGFKDPHNVVIDEVNQLVKDFCHTPYVKNSKKRAYLEEQKRLCRGAIASGGQVIVSDADLSDGAVLFVAELCGIDPSDVFIITSEPSKKAFKARMTFEASHHRDGLNRALNYNGKCCVAVESKSKAVKLYDRAIAAGKRALLIADDDKSADIMRLRNLDDIDIVIYTSKMGTGVSVEDRRFTKCFAMFYGTVLTAADAVQMLRRFRHAVDFDITVITQHRITGSDLPELEGVELEDWQAFFAHEEVFEKAHFCTAFEQLLKQRNFEIERTSLDFGDVVSTKEYKAEQLELTLNAQRIPSLHNTGSLTNQQKHENSRYYIERAFGEVTADTVKRYYADKSLAHRLISVKHDEEWQPVAEIISSLKTNMDRSQCLEAFKLITSNYELFRRLRAIPERWRADKKPRRPSAGSLAAFARHYGFDAESVGIHGELLTLSSDVFDIEQTLTKADKRAELIAEVQRLKREGKRVREIKDLLGVSAGFVSKWSKNECSRNEENVKHYNNELQLSQNVNAQKTTNNNELEVIEDQPTLDDIIADEVSWIGGLPFDLIPSVCQSVRAYIDRTEIIGDEREAIQKVIRDSLGNDYDYVPDEIRAPTPL